jgi:hypothetical protein
VGATIFTPKVFETAIKHGLSFFYHYPVSNLLNREY